MKKSLTVLAILISQAALAKDTCFKVTEAHYSLSKNDILSVHEVNLEDSKGKEYTLEDKALVEQILAKHAGVESITEGYEYSSLDEDLHDVSVCLSLKNDRKLSSEEPGLLAEYEGIKIHNAELTSININKEKKNEKKHLPLADTLNDLNELL